MTTIIYNGIEYRAYDHLYAVSKNGEVLRKYAPQSPRLRKDGYFDVGRNRLLHRMVATCWLERRDRALLVHHINGIKSDNRAHNLEWITAKEHIADRHKGAHGKHERTAETRAKLRAFRTGRKDTDDVRARKAAILDSVRIRQRRCTIDGIAYKSMLSAAKALGIHNCTVRYRVLSKHFPNYQLANE